MPTMRGAILAAVALTLAAPGRGGELPTWQLAEMDGLVAGQWRPVAQDPGGKYRAARAGRTATLTVPAWWGKAFRPPEQTVYVLEVEYQDAATAPVVFYAHAGLGRYWSRSEVHRFGGAGDGKWKTAHVPVSWDLLCRKNAPGDATELALRPNRDLPVRSIRVTPAGAAAAGRYFRETRQWVARAQAAKRKAADRGPRQEAVIPAALKGQAIVPYARSWMRPVHPSAAPQAGEAGAAIKLRMARNEYEPAAFAVYANGQALRNVTYRVGPLKGPPGVLKCELDLRTAEYSAVQATVDYTATADCGRYRMFPQRLWPAYPVDVPPGRSHLFWITVRTLGPASKGGKYAGLVRITAEVAGRAAEATLPIEVEVLPVTLLTVTQAGLSMGNCTTGLPTFQEVATLVAHNHNRMDIWFGGTQPGMTVRDGKLVLDWTYLDDWMAGARKLGLTEIMWFLGGDPKGFPDTLNLERDLYRARPGDRGRLREEFLRRASANPEKVLPEIRELYVDFIRQTARRAKARGWPKLIFQPFDEPGKWAHTRPGADRARIAGSGPWIRDHFKDACGLVRQGSREVRVGLEAHTVKPCLVFLKDVDIFCTNRAWQVPDLSRRLDSAGVEFWQYANCDDQAPPHRTRYSFGFYFGGYGSKGFLVWAYNWMSRFDTSARVNWGSGWHTPFGTVFAPSLVGLREGLDDRRWMETLRRRPDGKALLEAIGAEAIASRAKTPYTSYNEADDPAKMDLWRGRIMDAILRRRPK